MHCVSFAVFNVDFLSCVAWLMSKTRFHCFYMSDGRGNGELLKNYSRGFDYNEKSSHYYLSW